MRKLIPTLSLAVAGFASNALTADEANIAKGEAIYQSICFSCHGKNLEGATGPKLTDAEWVHGSSDQEIFNSIANGFLEKGMPGFKGVHTDADLRSVVAFIKSRRQGLSNLSYELYEGLSDEDFSFEKIAAVEPTKTGELPNGIMDTSFVEVQDYAILFKANLKAPNPETRHFKVNGGWQNRLRVLLDDEELNTGEHFNATDKVLESSEQELQVLWQRKHKNPRIRISAFLVGDNEQNGLSQAAVEHLKKTVFMVKAEGDEPYLVRKSIDRVPDKSIAVGFPGGLNYAYHAPTGAIVGAWKGDGLNIGPNIIGRGQEGSRPIDRWVFADSTGIGLTVDGQPTAFKLTEYTRGKTPTFLSKNGDYQLQVVVSPSGPSALKVNYTLSGKTPKSVELNVPAEAKIQCEDGSLSGNVLKIAPAKLTSFTLTLSE
ncbi:c-type cytochrome [Pelagicoccus mobilis]|uniref:Cytochrome c n=1 Tax=Pelagicoccus mobilis TaxID=415221 RepID=A0A934S076_9BACT|nr:cytochrome c [Pelagicoccus mobilis]MBK1878146.1 cytochrome c [Pelagicoccus mobilis]